MSQEALDRPLRDLTQPMPVITAASSSTQEPAHLREYLAVVLKRKWLILSLMIVVTSLVAIQMYRLPSQYEASGTIQIEQKAKSPVSTNRGGDIVIRGNDQTYWNTQLQKLKTQKLARQVILRLDLQNNPNFLGAGYKGLGVISGLRRIITREKPAEQPSPKSRPGPRHLWPSSAACNASTQPARMRRSSSRFTAADFTACSVTPFQANGSATSPGSRRPASFACSGSSSANSNAPRTRSSACGTASARRATSTPSSSRRSTR